MESAPRRRFSAGLKPRPSHARAPIRGSVAAQRAAHSKTQSEFAAPLKLGSPATAVASRAQRGISLVVHLGMAEVEERFLGQSPASE